MLNSIVLDIRTFHEYKNGSLNITWKKLNLVDFI